MNSPVEEIKRKIGIEEVVGSYIELKQSGKSLKALCPFHSEKTPSFTVSAERQSFYCFGCNKGGDIFTFVEEFEGVDFKGALKILAERAGVDIRHYTSTTQDKEAKEKVDRLYPLLSRATEMYQEKWISDTQARGYTAKRGITDETALRFGIGFAPDTWSFILDGLEKEGYSFEEIERAGLAIKSEAGKKYDRFRNRIMFPIADSSGRVVGFSGRTLDTDSTTAKYINSPETTLFKKRDILYGIDKAKLGIRKFGFSILVEGQMDLVLSHQAGFRNTVATSGTALRGRETEGEAGVSNLELVKRISKNIVIAFDSDTAGITATIKNAQLALSLGMDVKVARLPDGSDPADVILKDVKEWKRLVKTSEDAIEFQLQTIQNDAKEKKGVLKAVQAELFMTIAEVPSSVDREHYLGVVAEKIGIQSDTLLSEFETFRGRAMKKGGSTPHVVPPPKERAVLTFNEKHILATHIVILAQNTEIDRTSMVTFKERFQEIFSEPPEDVFKKIQSPEKEKYVFEIEEENQTVLEQKSYIEYLLSRITISELERKAKILLEKMKEAEGSADKEVTATIFNTYSTLLKKIEQLKQKS
ncbi:MAG: DNA primase [Candidatus Paceibacterota bacterium]